MVMRLIQKGSKAFTSQQHTILSAATVIAVIYLFSAFLGFIRNRLLSGYFGDSIDLGIYFAADDIPSLIFSLIVSGALSAAFIPAFTKSYKNNKEEGWSLTSNIMNISLVAFLIIGIFIMIGAKTIAQEIIARDSSLTQSNLVLMASIMRVMMLAQIILIFSSFFTSVLQSFKLFVIPALAPVFYNVGIIIFILFFIQRFGVFAPAWGMVFGALLHMSVQFIAVKKLGFSYSFSFDFRNKIVASVYRLMAPRAIGQAAQKFLNPLYTNLALFISAPSNVILTFATDIQMLPVRIFGMSIGQAALPILANAYKDNDTKEFSDLLLKTIRQIVFFVLPVSILMFILRVPLVRLTIGARKYSWEATVMTAYTLGFYCISLVAQSLILVLARAFFAMHDTKTPLKISLLAIFVNAFTAILFIRYMHLGVWSLGLSYALGSLIDAVLLFYYLLIRLKNLDLLRFVRSINKITLASVIMGIALYIPYRTLDVLIFDTTRTIGLIFLTGIVSLIGFVTFMFCAWIFKIEELDLILDTIDNRFLKKGFLKFRSQGLGQLDQKFEV